MSADTRDRFLRAAMTTAIETTVGRSVRVVAAEAHATPSLLYRYFGSIEELDAVARKLALGTVLGDDVGHGYLVDLLGGVAGTDATFDANDHAPTYVDNELFPQDHIAWLRRNSTFVRWLFSGEDFPDAFEQVRPGLVRELFFGGDDVHEQTCVLVIKTMAAWVCHAASCADEELPDVLRWAGDAIETITRLPTDPGAATTLSEAAERFEVDRALAFDI